MTAEPHPDLLGGYPVPGGGPVAVDPVVGKHALRLLLGEAVPQVDAIDSLGGQERDQLLCLRFDLSTTG